MEIVWKRATGRGKGYTYGSTHLNKETLSTRSTVEGRGTPIVARVRTRKHSGSVLRVGKRGTHASEYGNPVEACYG